MTHLTEGQGRRSPECLAKSRAALNLAPGCNLLESRTARLFVLLMVVIAVGAVWTR